MPCTWSRASSTSFFGYVMRTSTDMMMTRTMPPTHSAAANCHAISTQSTTPSSITRFVDENRKASDGMRAAPFSNSVLVTAAEAYKHDELAAPNAVAIAISRGPSRPSSWRIRALETSVCTAPEIVKPRTRLQPTCHSIPSAISSASPTFATSTMRCVPARRGRPLATQPPEAARYGCGRGGYAGSMRAIVVEHRNEPGTLREVPTPEPDAGEVLVRVAVAGINPVDWKSRDMYDHALPFVLGQDFAGTVAAVGEGVRRYVQGDRIFGIAKEHGAYAEYTIVPEDDPQQPVAKIPNDIGDADAAALPTAGL